MPDSLNKYTIYSQKFSELFRNFPIFVELLCRGRRNVNNSEGIHKTSSTAGGRKLKFFCIIYVTYVAGLCNINGCMVEGRWRGREVERDADREVG